VTTKKGQQGIATLQSRPGLENLFNFSEQSGSKSAGCLNFIVLILAILAYSTGLA